LKVKTLFINEEASEVLFAIVKLMLLLSYFMVVIKKKLFFPVKYCEIHNLYYEYHYLLFIIIIIFRIYFAFKRI